jgi:hypothetical protein
VIDAVNRWGRSLRAWDWVAGASFVGLAVATSILSAMVLGHLELTILLIFAWLAWWAAWVVGLLVSVLRRRLAFWKRRWVLPVLSGALLTVFVASAVPLRARLVLSRSALEDLVDDRREGDASALVPGSRVGWFRVWAASDYEDAVVLRVGCDFDGCAFLVYDESEPVDVPEEIRSGGVEHLVGGWYLAFRQD